MSTVIVYYTMTGNAEKMSDAILQGIKAANSDADVFQVSDTNVDDIAKYDKIVFGCSSYGDEVLEESEFEPFYTDIEDKIAGKKVALFGSYDWGDGQWMRDWEERAKAKGANLFGSVIVNLEPEGEEFDKCVKFGSDFAAF